MQEKARCLPVKEALWFEATLLDENQYSKFKENFEHNCILALFSKEVNFIRLGLTHLDFNYHATKCSCSANLILHRLPDGMKRYASSRKTEKVKIFFKPPFLYLTYKICST